MVRINYLHAAADIKWQITCHLPPTPPQPPQQPKKKKERKGKLIELPIFYNTTVQKLTIDIQNKYCGCILVIRATTIKP